MAANFVAVNAIDGAADASGTTVSPSTLNVTTGNLLVVGVRWEGGGLNDDATATITDSAGNTYQLIGYTFTGHATENQKVGLWYVLSATGSATNLITATLSAARTFKAIFVRQYSYTGTIELGATGSGSSSTNVTSLTTSPSLSAVAGDVVVGWFANYNNSPPTFTADTPFTIVSSSIYARYLERIVATGGTFAPSITADGSGDTYAALSAVFQEAAGGGGNNYTITAEFGTYNLSGQAAALLSVGSLTAETGLYTLLGSNAVRDIEINAERGSYSLNGQDAGLIGTALLIAAAGAYSIIGQSANLLYSFAASIARPKGQRRMYGFRLSR